MPPITITAVDLKQVVDRSGLFRLLRNKLGWPSADPEDPFTYDVKLDGRDVKANVSQIVPFGADDPHPVMLVETDGAFKRSELREILRGVRAEMRNRARYQGKNVADIIFVVAADGYRDIRFCRFTEQDGRQPKLQSFGWMRGEEDATRTLREVNLPLLKMPLESASGGWDWDAKTWQDAWNVEKVQKEFFRGLRAVFEKYLDAIILVNATGSDEKLVEQGEEVARLMLQTVVNRLLFLAFVQKKGWLIPPGEQGSERKKEYLFALYDFANPSERGFDFHERMRQLFFEGLCQADDVVRQNPHNLQRIGTVPYLHGSLFEAGKYEQQLGDYADLGWIKLPNGFYAELIGPEGVFRKFNFTIGESTPDDVEIAVDPEMLGLVFEELMTLREAQESSRRKGDDPRHATGSYYTPRNIVQFMCREALKVYLEPFGNRVDLDALINRQALAGNDIPLAELRSAVEKIKVCDPACGSGAYLVGMLHELNEVLKVLDSKIAKDRAGAARSDYKRKLLLLQNAIYGVDLQEFAANMARLRFWLSVAVDMVEPDPLPNLEYKIESGDTLLAPDPSSDGNLFLQAIHEEADQLGQLKTKYSDPFDPSNKAELKRQIDNDLQTLRAAAEQNAPCPEGAFDWRVEFAEVFVERDGKDGGFDVVLANPPYVRNEELEDAAKAEYVRIYAGVVTRRSDLYCSFYARALQLTRQGGINVFVCSNSWLDVEFGAPLQRHLLTSTQVIAILDSAVEKQFTSAEINTIISFCRKGRPSENAETAFVQFRAPFEDAVADPSLRREIRKTCESLWQEGLGEPDRRGVREFEGDKWGGKFFRAPDIYWEILARAEDRLVRLGTLAQVRFGVKTGANDFFYVRVLSVSNGIATIQSGDGTKHCIEEEFVEEAALVRAKEMTRPLLTESDLPVRVVRLPATVPNSSHAAAYIRYGEAMNLPSRASLRDKLKWYVLPVQPQAPLVLAKRHKRRPVSTLLNGNIQVDQVGYPIYPYDESTTSLIALSLLSTFVTLAREVHGRANFGQGLLELTSHEAALLPVLSSAAGASIRSVPDILDSISRRNILMLYDDVRQPDRMALDRAFLLAIGFDELECDSVVSRLHEAACRVVWQRQSKAGNTREARHTFDEWRVSGVPFGGEED